MKPLEEILRRFLTKASIRPRSTGAKLAWAVTLLSITSSVRWALEVYLQGEIPFFLYLPAVLIITSFCGWGAGFGTLAASLALTLFLWMPRPFTGWRIDLTSLLSLTIWFLVSSALIVAIALLQKSASAQRDLMAELNQKSRRLEENSARLEVSEKQLAAHAGQLERLVAERTTKLEETVAELEAFSYTVSHDLRSPLRAMQGFAHLLLAEYTENLDTQACEYLHRIDRAAQRLDALIRDVLSYSSVGPAAVNLQPVDLDGLLTQVASQYPAVGDALPHIQIARPLLPVIANESCFIQALSNLIQNAAKFVNPGSKPAIKIWTEAVGSRVRLHVTDQGIGIPPTALAHIFKPFHRGHGTAEYPGNGIGLAIVKRAVERQGGSVGVSSKIAKGSDFWIELPLAKSQSTLPLHE